MKQSIHSSAFTLIELIVVITILAILATIAFVSYEGYTASARDSQRLSNIKNIETGLALFQAKSGSFPMPESKTIGGAISTGSIAGTTYAYLGVIGDTTAAMLNISKASIDPVSGDKYLYATSADGRYFQTATVMEKTQASHFAPIDIFDTTYAATTSSTLKAKVIGNYPGCTTFAIGSDTYFTNTPSFLWNNTGSIQIFSTGGTYSVSPNFIVNNQGNLPYSVNSDPIGNLSPDELIQSINGSGALSYTGVDITNILTLPDIASKQSAIATLFGTGATPAARSVFASCGGSLDSMNVRILGSSAAQANSSTAPQTHSGCIFSGTTISHGQSVTAYSEAVILWNAAYDCTARQQTRICTDGVLSGDASYQYDSCVKGTPNSCSASGSYVYNSHAYSIPTLAHGSGSTNLVSSNIPENNGIFTYTLSTIECNDGNYASLNESTTKTLVSCDSGYHTEDSTTCTSDTKSVACTQSGGPTHSQYIIANVNVTWNTGTSTWNTPANCAFTCTDGYTGADCSVAPITDWRSVDTNCTKADIPVGSQIWAGCNSTLGTITPANTYNNGVCYNYAGGNASTTACYGATTQENWKSGQSDNIYGGLYQWNTLAAACLANHDSGTLPITNTTCPCQSGYHIPSQTEWDALEISLGCNGTNKLTGSSGGWECMTNTTDTTN